MRAPVLTILFFSCAIHASAQVNEFSANVSGVMMKRTIRIFSSPQIVINQKRHSWHIGPTILWHSENTASDNNYPKLSGVQVDYRYNPIKDKNLSLFLYSQLQVQHIKNEWSSNIWNYDLQSYVRHRYKNAEFMLVNHYGYGIRLKIFKSFYINQNVGLGVYFSDTDNDETSSGAPEISDKNINGYDDFGFTWGINLSLSYTL